MSRLWYVNTAVHLWRFYFRYRTADPEKMGSADRENWYACDRAIKQFTDNEINCLRQYFLTGYGNYDDMRAIEDYVVRNGISRSDAWDMIKKANYTVIVERGLMEPNQGGETDG